MRKFLGRCALFAVGLAALTGLVLVLRVVGWESARRDSMSLRRDQKVLMIGDSHIGCSFVEERKYGNKVIWESAAAQQYTWMRLQDMERSGILKNVDTVVLDLGLQSFGQQTVACMEEHWWRMIPITWRYPDALPMSYAHRFLYLLNNLSGRIHIIEALPTNNVSVLDRALSAEKLAQDARDHMRWVDAPERMCSGWEQSIRRAIGGIVDVCRRNHIRLVFFSSPLPSFYRKEITDKAESVLSSFTQYVLSQGVEYYDLRNWSEDRCFMDCHHLTHDGAAKFTERFFKEILNRVTVDDGL